tara:strand:- start:1590 stop:1892 length:303 start_codon:yes stop_codon:yes gene_type:complete
MFAVGLPIVQKIQRGYDDRREVQCLKDEIRFAIDKENSPRRRVAKNKNPNLSNTHTAVIKSISNIGHDDRRVVQSAREKLQFNKANSLFNSTPYSNQFLS